LEKVVTPEITDAAPAGEPLVGPANHGPWFEHGHAVGQVIDNLVVAITGRCWLG
jgi:hypothetical protein